MCSVLGAQLLHDIAYMPFHCIFTDCQGVSRLLVRQAISDMLQHLALSVGDTVLIDVSRQFRRDLWRKTALSGCQVAYGCNEVMAQRTFQKIASRPRLDCL